MRKMKAALIFALTAAMLFTGCSGKDDDVPDGSPEPPTLASPAPTPTETPAPEPTETPEPEYTGPYNPLTGLPVDEEHADTRPFAIMLNNIRDALPQQGNSQADIIYEVLAEGGITRMLGVYQSVDGVEKIGSVRSARPYYIELAMGHDAVYVHAGGSEEAYFDLSSWGTDHMDGVNGKFSSSSAGVFWRDQYRIDGKKYAYEHSLLTSGAGLEAAAESFGVSMKHADGYDCGLKFADDGTPAGGTAAESVSVFFSSYKTGVFNYDGQTGTYLVEEYGSPYIDGNDGSQVSVTNVIVLKTSCYNSGDSYGHMRVSLESGTGYFACGGKMIPITWSKNGRNSPIRYYNEDGSELVLGAGKSYVCIIPKENSVTAQ